MNLFTRNCWSCLIAWGMIAFVVAFAPASTARAALVDRDLSYVSPGGTSNRLDLYRPDTGALPGTPTFVFVHGGGWNKGDKALNAVFLAAMADAGFPAVSCNYTLSRPGAPSYPQAVYDLKAVVRWVRTRGLSRYGLSPSIILMGESAGGHLAMMIGTTRGIAAFEPLAPPPGGYGVDAVISLAGTSNLVTQVTATGAARPVEQFVGASFVNPPPPVFLQASPITYVNAGDPPFAFFHGTADTVVPWEQSRDMNAALRGAGVPTQLFYSPGGGHGFAAFGGEAATAQLVVDEIPVLLSLAAAKAAED